MANIEELDRVIAHIEAHPEQHDQGDWIIGGQDGSAENNWCGTSACVAGWTVLLNGWRPHYWSPDHEWPSTASVVRDGKHTTARIAAIDLLGLTEAEASVLFFADNTLEDIKTIRDVLAAGLGDDVWEPWFDATANGEPPVFPSLDPVPAEVVDVAKGAFTACGAHFDLDDDCTRLTCRRGASHAGPHQDRMPSPSWTDEGLAACIDPWHDDERRGESCPDCGDPFFGADPARQQPELTTYTAPGGDEVVEHPC